MPRSPVHDLNPLWLRAAMLGSTWAAIEIVLGSFLHNIRFPLTGTILASIGIVILTAGARIWPDRGLLWRAGVICALMKSISPSAVIVGPMIGIASEALAVDLAVRAFGVNTVGLLIGGSAAALLPLVQKIVSLVVTYGPDITLLYVRLVEFAATTLSMPALGPVEVLLAFAVVNLFLGLAAVLTGIAVGRRVMTVPREQAIRNGAGSPFALAEVDPRQQFSLLLLALHALAMVLGLFAIRVLPFLASVAFVLLYVLVALALYPAVLKKLSRPRLWVEFAVISLLAGWFLGQVGSAGSGFDWSGLAIGAEMSLRASLVVVGFSSIGIELRNPVLVSWFLRRGLGRMARALEVAFEALPQMISAFGDQKRFLRSPVEALARTIASGVEWLRSRLDSDGPAPTVFLVTGQTAAGKTSFLVRLVEVLNSRGVSVGGILAPGLWNGDERAGFNVRDIRTGGELPLARRNARSSAVSTGPFGFDKAGLAFGTSAIDGALADGVQVLCIDEVGPLEIEGGGWALSLRRALASHQGLIVLVIRSRLIARAQELFGFRAASVWSVPPARAEAVADDLLAALAVRK